MLYLLAEWLDFEGLFNLVRYQTFRAGATLLTALFLGLVIGPKFINMLRVRQGKGQPIREDGPQTHKTKVGTPTMGGLMILTSLVLAMLIWMNPATPLVWACLAVTMGFGVIGFLDDLDKVTKRSHKGVSGKVRLMLEFIVAGVATWVIVGFGNAVNLTDGLDGLATMPVVIAAGAFLLICYLVGRVDYSAYL